MSGKKKQIDDIKKFLKEKGFKFPKGTKGLDFWKLKTFFF